MSITPLIEPPKQLFPGEDHADLPDAEPDETHEITHWLQAWRQGDATALNQLIPLVSSQLRKLAHRHLQRERQDSLQTSDLLQKAWMKLWAKGNAPPELHSRAHFYTLASHVMRQILIDAARRRQSKKRQHEKVLLSEFTPEQLERLRTNWPDEEMLWLDELLEPLRRHNADCAMIVELKIFGGFELPEIADLLQREPHKIDRQWRIARAWLSAELDQRRKQ